MFTKRVLIHIDDYNHGISIITLLIYIYIKHFGLVFYHDSGLFYPDYTNIPIFSLYKYNYNIIANPELSLLTYVKYNSEI
jgi:hypothetical protein